MMKKIDVNCRQMAVAISAYIGQMIIGYALGWSSSALPKFENEDQTPLPHEISATEASLIGSLLFFGAVFAPIFTINLANAWGRKPCLFLGGVFSLCAYLILALPLNLSMVYAGRIFAGVGAGTLLVINVVYIGEIASKNIRGILLSCTGVSTSFGTFISYSTGPFVTYAGTAYIGLSLCLCFLLGLFIVPESPTFYVIKDDKIKVKEILQSLGRTSDLDEVLASKVIKTKREWMQLFKIKTNRKALFITSSLQILQQCSGVVAIVFFTTNIFAIANSSIEPHIATIIVGLTQITGSFITPFIIEKSRRILLLISTAVCSICLVSRTLMALLGTYFYLDDANFEIVYKMQWVPLASLIIYFMGYNMGFGVIPSTLAGEMFRSNVRSIGSTVAIISGLVFGFIVTSVFGYVITYLGGFVVFWAFSAINALTFLFTIFCVPETKGKTLMEIQSMMEGSA